MAKRKARRGGKKAKPARPSPKPARRRKATTPRRKKTPAKARPVGKKGPAGKASSGRARRGEAPGLTPPSSLDLARRASAARTGRAEMAEHERAHRTMTPAITGGDVDADVENAYFSGDEAPGGDNPTPDQDIVDNIGRALGVQYDDREELRPRDKVKERDKHRWEMDPASSDDYKDRE